MILVADTSPLNYLVQIDHFDIVERLYGHVIIPEAVYRELTDLQSPDSTAEQLRADAILIDDKQGRAEAAKRNLAVIGTLGVLAAAAEKGFLDLPDAIQRLQQTSFHISPQILQVLLKRYSP